MSQDQTTASGDGRTPRYVPALDGGPQQGKPTGGDGASNQTTRPSTDVWRPRVAVVPREPTEAMLIAAREWSRKKYGKPIGDDDARGCWAAMLEGMNDA